MLIFSPKTLPAYMIGLFVTLFLFLTGILQAQQDFRPGYIITLEMDTLYGEIDYRGDILMSTTCRFKAPETKKIKAYTPDDLFGFRFTDSKYYVAETLESGERLFLQYLVNGKLSVYCYRDSEGSDHYLINKMGLPLRELPYSEGIISRKDGNDLFKQSYFHMGLLKVYTQDAPEIQKEILRIKKPDSENLIKLAEDYHKKVCNDEKCIVYEKKLPMIGIVAELLYGFTRYNGVERYFSEYGGNLYLWLPRSNEKLYFKTGLSNNRIADDEEALNIFKIPIQIVYMYPGRIFIPKANIGIDLYAIRMNKIIVPTHLFAIGTGCNIALNKSLGFSTNINFDFTPITKAILEENVTFDLISYTFNGGIFLRF